MGDTLESRSNHKPDIMASHTTQRYDAAAAGPRFATISVAVVGICSGKHLMRCLEALRYQIDAPPFDIVVAYDPHISDLDPVREAFPDIRMVANAGQRTPLELASRAIRESTGDLVLLTEDHCVPDPRWVRVMIDAQGNDRAAVGGLVLTDPRASATDWAFYFVDFFRYTKAASAGPSPTLTVCNVSYQRKRVQAIRDLWIEHFHETAVNDALRARFGPLWLEPQSQVTMGRHVRLSHAVYERYAFGRLFGCTRLKFCTPRQRACYTLFAPALPALLLGRMIGVAMQSRESAASLLRAAVPLTLMVLSWSWGEWLGYLTRRLPRTLNVAPELRVSSTD